MMQALLHFAPADHEKTCCASTERSRAGDTCVARILSR